MNGKADRRRPLAVAMVLVAAIGAALVAPVMIGARQGEPIPGSTVRADSRESVTVTVPLTLFSTPSVKLDKGTVTLVGPPASESRVGALLRALVMGEGADLVIDGASFVVDRTPQTESAGSGGAAPEANLSEELASIVSALGAMKFRSLALMNSSIEVKTAHGTVETFSDVAIDVAPDTRGLVKAKGRLTYRDEPLDVEVAFTQPAPDAPPGPVQIRASIKGELIAMAFDGRLAPGERGITAPTAELSISDLRGAASWLGVPWPSGSGLGLFTAKGQLTLDDRMLSFEHAEFALDGNAATGALTAKIGAERPSIEGTLAFSSFDIAPYAAPARPSTLALVSDWVSTIRLPGVASPSFLQGVDADIRLSAGSVMSGSDRLGRIAASLSVKAGKVYGEVVELELEQGGNGEGQFTADLTGKQPRYTVRAEFNDMDLATALGPRLGRVALEGAGDIRLDLHAEGATQSDVRRSLGGTLSLDMSEGARIGLDVNALPAAAVAPAAPAEASAASPWQQVTAGTTAVRRLTARLTAAAGVVTTESVQATMETANLSAAGSVDLGRGIVDVVLSVVPAGSAGTQADSGLAAYRIQGPWPEPAIRRIEPGKAARNLAPGSDPG